jgi:hypothetical protein
MWGYAHSQDIPSHPSRRELDSLMELQLGDALDEP